MTDPHSQPARRRRPRAKGAGELPHPGRRSRRARRGPRPAAATSSATPSPPRWPPAPRRRRWRRSNPVPAAGGDPNILELPAHTTGLGLGVATDGYGKPSKFEANVQRRQSPGLTQTQQSSVSFAPLQSLFGIVTPSGLHFERHHQGWWDIDPSKHRLMVNGSDEKMVRTPMVFTMDELMRLPSVEPLPLHRVRRQHRHGVGQRRRADLPVQPRHAQLQRIHRRAAEGAARHGRRRLQARPLRARRGRRRLVA